MTKHVAYEAHTNERLSGFASPELVAKSERNNQPFRGVRAMQTSSGTWIPVTDEMQAHSDRAAAFRILEVYTGPAK